MAELTTGFLCTLCGMRHDTLPLSFSVKAPLAVTRVPATELEQRVVITRDQCVIDGTMFFLRGRIIVPIVGLNEPFIWGVWAEISPSSFIRTHELWTTPGREAEPPYPGWLDVDLPFYGTTVNLEVSVKTQVIGRRPHFEIVCDDHALSKQQREGIALSRVAEMAAWLLHGEPVARGTA
ncbi:MAG: DUF2199 domain-containing protein [Janthinobacterium lividum]